MGGYLIDPVSQFNSMQTSVPTSSYYDPGVTGSIDTNLEFNVQCMKTMVFYVKNTGTDGASFKVDASIDEGATYDVVIASEASIAPGATVIIAPTGIYTNIRFSPKSAGSTVFTVKSIASTN